MECSIEVNNKESNYKRFRNCKGIPKYKVWYKWSKTTESLLSKIVCERHKKQLEKEFFIIDIKTI